MQQKISFCISSTIHPLPVSAISSSERSTNSILLPQRRFAIKTRSSFIGFQLHLTARVAIKKRNSLPFNSKINLNNFNDPSLFSSRFSSKILKLLTTRMTLLRNRENPAEFLACNECEFKTTKNSDLKNNLLE